jgi:glycine/D-amino acid oxidase-like deaminating enzyme
MSATDACFCGPSPSAAAAAAALRPSAPALLGLRLRIESFSPPTRRRRPVRRVVACDGQPPDRVAVIGGGLAGLATAYHLLHSTYRVANKRGADFTKIRVAVFDPAPPGTSAGASAVAAGLLHPFTPRVKRQAWQALKGMNAALTLIDAAQAFSDTPLLKAPGILRLCLTPKQDDDFHVAKRRFPRQLDLMSADELLETLPDPPPDTPGVLQNEGVVVDTPAYLRALWAACEATGRVAWSQRRVDAFEDLFAENFDAVVVCAGAATRTVSNMASLPIMPCRGQNVRYRPRHPASTRPPPFPLISGKYVIPDLFSDAPGSIIAGATFEYCDPTWPTQDALDFAAGTAPPDMAAAAAQLAEPLAKLSPMLNELYVAESAVAGVRALPPRSMLGSVPIAGEVKGAPEGKAAWVLTGLGSRGLLHHAYLGKLVARAVVAGSDTLVPHDARRVPLVYEDLIGPHRPDTASKVLERPMDSVGTSGTARGDGGAAATAASSQ